MNLLARYLRLSVALDAAAAEQSAWETQMFWKRFLARHRN